MSMPLGSRPGEVKEYELRGQGKIADRIRRKQTRQWLLIVLVAALLIAVITAIWISLAHPNADHRQNEQLSQTQQRLDEISKPVFPVNAIETQAYQAAYRCLSYTDQQPEAAITDLRSACGWNGSGVANLEDLHFAPDASLRSAVTQNNYSVLPFVARFLGQDIWLPYWVPVQQTGPHTAKIAGMGVPLNSLPTFIVNGCPQGTHLDDKSGAIAAVEALVRGEPRYALPGHALNFNGNGLTNATASEAIVCEGPGDALVLATVTYNGPTPDAQFKAGYAFKTKKEQNGEIRISDVGLNVGYKAS